MSLDFNGTSDFLTNTSTPPISGTPVTLAGWFKSDDDTAGQAIISIGTSATANHRFSLVIRGDVGGDPVSATVQSTAASAATTSSGYTAGTWHHACGVFTGDTARAAFIDGGSKGTNATSRIPSGMDRMDIGKIQTSSQFFNGLLAEIGVWADALTDAEVAILAKGVSPILVRPESLVAYFPLIGRFSPEIDRVGGFNMTLSGAGATVAAHPRIIYPRRFEIANKAAGVPASDAVPQAWAQYRRRAG